MTKAEATEITGGLSYPSKMPDAAWSIPAANCHTGSRLAKVDGTVCQKCYALKGRYNFPGVQAALTKRLEAIDHPRWVEAMTFLIKPILHFRWFDSGDIQSASHLRKIFDICRNTPDTHHWLPTRERRFVNTVLRRRSLPSNLALRFSASMVGRPASPNRHGLPSAVVSTTGYDCPAPDQGNQCGTCRRCWDPTNDVTYKWH